MGEKNIFYERLKGLATLEPKVFNEIERELGDIRNALTWLQSKRSSVLIILVIVIAIVAVINTKDKNKNVTNKI